MILPLSQWMDFFLVLMKSMKYMKFFLVFLNSQPKFRCIYKVTNYYGKANKRLMASAQQNMIGHL